MSTVGWIGLGKLGFTCALGLAKFGGHLVAGYDPSPHPRQMLNGQIPLPEEAGIQEVRNGA